MTGGFLFDASNALSYATLNKHVSETAPNITPIRWTTSDRLLPLCSQHGSLDDSVSSMRLANSSAQKQSDTSRSSHQQISLNTKPPIDVAANLAPGHSLIEVTVQAIATASATSCKYAPSSSIVTSGSQLHDANTKDRCDHVLKRLVTFWRLDTITLTDSSRRTH